jgi:hypothetical protein
MHKLILGAILALALPGAAAAATAAPNPPTPADLAKAACKTEKHEMGTRLFKKTYAAKSAAKAVKACIAKTVPVAESDTRNAAQACKAERTADPDAFAEKYGSNKNNKNAYGKCVSGQAQKATQDAAKDRANAAKTCKALKRDDPSAFVQAYGTKKNAFGKCVSATAKANAEDA